MTDKHVLKWRENHHKALAQLRGPKCKKSGVALWRTLNRIEQKIHYAATAYCNGTCTPEQYDREKENAEKQVSKLFGHAPNGFFINSDPRGYSLKIDEAHVPDGMHKDMGGYGILAAMID